MKQQKKLVLSMLIFSALILLVILLLQPLQVFGLRDYIAVLFPQGLIALEERNLLLIIQVIMLFVIIPVYILTFVFSLVYGADQATSKYEPDLIDNKVAEYIWWGLPLVLTVFISVLTVFKTYQLDPYKPIVSKNKEIKIQVVALQWRWLFIYPEEQIASVNFLQFPIDTPLHFEITSDAPMNSFWIPELGGQIYAMPGMMTQLYLIADKTGDYEGVSANLSGEGFADMHFIARASTEEEYQQWVQSVKKSSKTLNLAEYKKLSEKSRNTQTILYVLGEVNLFNHIVSKYMSHQGKE